MAAGSPGSQAEAGLLEAAQRGDGEAFGRLLEPYRAELHAHCYRMLGSFHNAEDVFQETLLRAWRALPRFGGQKRLRPWLFKIATNACLDALKQRPKRLLPTDYAPMVATADIAAVAAGALRERNWNGVVVRELIGPRDLTYTEAAAAIGAAIGQPDLQYVQLPDEELMAILTEAVGFSPDFAALFVEFNQAPSEGRLHSLEGRNQSNTTPTEFEEFAAELARAYAATAYPIDHPRRRPVARRLAAPSRPKPTDPARTPSMSRDGAGQLRRHRDHGKSVAVSARSSWRSGDTPRSLVVGGRRLVNLPEFEHLGSAVPVMDDGLHGV